MSIANTDYIQATIELFGFIITAVMAFIFWIITGNKKKSAGYLMSAMLLSGLALLVDAGWYVFDGDPSAKAQLLNRLCNLSIFLCNPCMLLCINRYLCANIRENGGETIPVLHRMVDAFAVLSFLMPVSNLFFSWMYVIDGSNVYSRLFGWYVYTVVNSLGIITCLVMVILQRRMVSRWRGIAHYVFLLAPFAGIALQSMMLGISFIQIGSAIGCLGIVVSYTIEWIRQENADNDITDDRKRLWIIECVFAIMILFVSASIISCVVSVYKVSTKNSEQSSTALMFMVSQTVDGALSEPVNVSKTMAQSYIVRRALEMDTLEGSEEEAQMLSFMKRIKEEYHYQMIFVASEKTKAYYTYDGLSRYMQVDTDARDAWYNEYKARQIEYELNIDADKDNDMALAVFINMEVRDDTGKLIGVCGVATSIESMMDILSGYERAYDLDISLTDRAGIVQVSTDREKIGLEQLTGITLTDDSELVSYTKTAQKARLTKYMKGLDWYLVIDDYNPDKLSIYEIVLPSMVIYVLGVVLMITFSVGFGLREKRRSRLLYASRKLSETDGLTGLRNRYSLDVFIEKIQQEGMPDKLAILMVDINGLKAANDGLGHNAGDELIMGAADCLVSVFGNDGYVYRNGGDEFVVTAFCDDDAVQDRIALLERTTDRWHGKLVSELAVAVGQASHQSYPGATVLELLKLADKAMYENKNAYYARTGKKRRQSGQ